MWCILNGDWITETTETILGGATKRVLMLFSRFPYIKASCAEIYGRVIFEVIRKAVADVERRPNMEKIHQILINNQLDSESHLENRPLSSNLEILCLGTGKGATSKPTLFFYHLAYPNVEKLIRGVLRHSLWWVRERFYRVASHGRLACEGPYFFFLNLPSVDERWGMRGGDNEDQRPGKRTTRRGREL